MVADCLRQIEFNWIKLLPILIETSTDERKVYYTSLK